MPKEMRRTENRARKDRKLLAVLFLVSGEAGFITGSTMSINRGQHMH